MKLPVCTESKIDIRKTSREVGNQVKSIIGKGLSVYQVDGKLLKKLQPDVIVTQTQCEVYAVSPKDLDRAVRDWTGSEPCIVTDPEYMDIDPGDFLARSSITTMTADIDPARRELDAGVGRNSGR
jgi:iron complex transport system substrate-binding protein